MTLVELSLLTAVDAMVGTSGSVAVTNTHSIRWPRKKACLYTSDCNNFVQSDQTFVIIHSFNRDY